jgi:CheY-like chemotaxis protein
MFFRGMAFALWLAGPRRRPAMPKRILVIEDDVIALANISYFLRQEGYEVEEARDGRLALGLLAQRAFDLLLSDIEVPGADGYEILNHARANSTDTPVVLMTGNFASRGGPIPLSNPDAFLLKPLQLFDLAKTLSDVFERNGARERVKRAPEG